VSGSPYYSDRRHEKQEGIGGRKGHLRSTGPHDQKGRSVRRGPPTKVRTKSEKAWKT